MTPRALLVACAALVLACAPARPQAPWERESPLRPPPAPPLGVQADFTQLGFAVTPAKVRLGRWLFFDRRLSAGARLACADCHHPEHAFSERTAVSTGIAGRKGRRKAPSLVNVGFPLFPNFFRDGRAGSLAEQILGPLTGPDEMGSTVPRSVAAIASVAGYRRAFAEAFGDERVDIGRIGEAIAAYEVTRLSGDSPYDRFDAGQAAALDGEQQRGRALFYGKAACSQCHLGWNFSDARFHNLGVGFANGAFADEGRGRVSGRREETGAFKTPTLRDVARHPPYMHDGSLATLRDVVDFYDRGGVANPWLSPKLRPLHLDEAEARALVAFLESLGGHGYEDQPPARFPE